MIFFGYKRFILLYADYKFDKRDEDVNQLTYKDCKYIVMNKIQTSTKEKTTNINKHTQRCTHEPVAYTNELKSQSDLKKPEKEPRTKTYKIKLIK
jgi:hypothetical protein